MHILQKLEDSHTQSLHQIVFLSNFAQIEPTLTFNPGMKGVHLNNGNYFFSWEDSNYQKQLPQGVQTDRAPFIQVGITSSGYIFSYNNTIDLYRNALKEFNLTQ